jgi:hypothetical protein
MDTQGFEKLMKDINDRLTAMGDSTSPQKVEGMVKTYLDNLLKDETFVRKMRFGGDGGERKLVGSKYARWSLSIADVEWLYDLQMSLKGQKRVEGDGSGVYEGPSEELRNTFEAISEAYYMPQEKVREIDRRAIDDLFPRIPAAWFHGKDRNLANAGKFELTEAYKAAIRAMDTAETGYGLQLIGAQYVGDLWGVAREQSKVFPLIDSFEMTAPVAYLPVEVDFPELLYVGESTTYNAANYATVKTGSNKATVTAMKFVIHQMWSGELEEDSIVAFVPFLRRQIALSLGYYSDSLVLNGDNSTGATGNINSDDEAPAATKHFLAFDGIRHACLVDNTGNTKDLAGAGISLQALKDQQKRMVDSTYKIDWGHPLDPNDLIYACDLDTGDKIDMVDEFATYDKAGNKAMIAADVQEQLFGHPLIRTLAISKTEADGKLSYDTPTNNIYGQVVTFNRRGFKVGWRRRVKMETERIPATDQSRLVYSLRLGFGRFSPTGAVGGIESSDVIFNIAVA